jgi:hypothetical protein
VLVAAIPVRSVAELHRLLAEHVEACCADLRAWRDAPSIYSAGVRYRAEPRGSERWQLPRETEREGSGDCEDLASWLCAQLRVTGEDTRATVTTYQSAPGIRHCVVRRGNGTIEDPSRRLGMGSERDKAERAELRGIGAENMATGAIQWNVRRATSGAWVGEMTLRLDPSLSMRGLGADDETPPAAITVRAAGRSRGDAATRTMAAVSSVMNSPLVRTLLPPQAMMALKAAQGVAKLMRGLFRKRKRRVTVSGLEVTPRYVARALQRRGMSPALLGWAEVCGDW